METSDPRVNPKKSPYHRGRSLSSLRNREVPLPFMLEFSKDCPTNGRFRAGVRDPASQLCLTAQKPVSTTIVAQQVRQGFLERKQAIGILRKILKRKARTWARDDPPHCFRTAQRRSDAEFHADGSGQLHMARSETDQTADGAVLCLGPAAVEAPLAITPEKAVIDPRASVFRLQISRRVKATKTAGLLAAGVSAHSTRARMAQGPSTARRSCRSSWLLEDGRSL